MDNDKNSLEKLEDSLYSRKYKEHDPNQRSEFTPSDVNPVKPEWETNETDLTKLFQKQIADSEQNIYKKILWVSIGFFFIALGIGAFMFFGGKNTVSSGNIDIAITGPAGVSGGENLKLGIIVRNRNSVAINSATLDVEYPAGTKTTGDVSKDLLRETIDLGTIQSDGKVEKNIEAIIFGEKDSLKNIKFTLEYRLKDSSAVFYKEKNYELAIKTSPVILLADYQKEVASGQEVNFTITLVSNTSDLLKNVLVKAEYPFGFSFSSAEPKPTVGNNVWNVGDLSPGSKKVFKIKGVLDGQNNEERIFRFFSGIASSKNQNAIGAELSKVESSIFITKPFLSLSLSLNGDSSSSVNAKPGERVEAKINWSNNLPDSIFDGKIEVKLSGGALDKNTVVPLAGGFYRSADNTIVWDKNSNDLLGEIKPGEGNTVSFYFSTGVGVSGTARNQEVDVVVKMSGNQVAQSQSSQLLETSTSRTLRLSSVLSIIGRVARSIGTFETQGPIPPKADKDTTYNVIWTLSNSLNDINKTKVTAALPQYVKWESLVSPNTEKISFDPNSRMLTWNIGDMKAGLTKEVTFQIRFTPSLSQVGSSPILIGETRVTGEDSFTKKPIDITSPSLNTRFSTDPTFKDGNETVVQ